MSLYSQAALFVGSPDATDKLLMVGTEATYSLVTPDWVPEDGQLATLSWSDWHVTPLGQHPRKHIMVLGK
jgi:muconolactone delta-isomerase